ncbi:MAG: 2OG-Fe(II) oxygenase, partial [Alphaproteobacteria bacterium]
MMDRAARLLGLNWNAITARLDEDGYAILDALLPADECQALAARYTDDTLFCSHIDMARHGYGRGAYKYFSYPLPDLVASLRTALYPGLARIANDWNARLGIEVTYPARHEAYLETCHAAGQTRPTPLLLEYGPDDYNRLHQDVYGEHVFPLQAAVLLSASDDFTGGEFILRVRPEILRRITEFSEHESDG